MSLVTKLRKLQRTQNKGTLLITKTRKKVRKHQSYFYQWTQLEPINKILTEQAKSTWSKISNIIPDHDFNLEIQDNLVQSAKRGTRFPSEKSLINEELPSIFI